MNFDFTQEPGKKFYKDTVKTEVRPLISVITPFYNAGGDKFLQLYRCVINQSFQSFEWIIVNDGSTDKDSINQLNDLCATDSRIRVINKENGGVCTARNRGIEESRTDIIVTLDADELMEPTYFEMLYWALFYNQDCSFSYSDSLGFEALEYTWNPEFDAERIKTYNFMVESAAFRKSALLDVGGYDESQKFFHEDWHLWLKLLSRGHKPVKVSSYEFWYRRTDNGRMNSINSDPEKTKISEQMIAEAAKSVDGSIKAKTFGGEFVKDAFFRPKKFEKADQYYSENNEKKNILFIVPWLVMGGADRFNLDVVRLIDKEKFNVIMATTIPSENPWKQKFREYVSEIYTLPDFLDAENYPEFITYLIESRKIDLFFISDSYYGYYLAPWLKMNYPKMAIIDYVHMEELYWRAGGYPRVSKGIADVIEKTYICNECSRRYMTDVLHAASESVETLYIGVDHKKYNPQNVEAGQVRKSYQIRADQKIVLFPCRLNPQKRPYLMLEIAKEIHRRQGDKIVFLIVGDGDERSKMEKMVSRYGIGKIVIFAGEQDDMRSFYKDADLTLICSIKEGLALTSYESCAMATPVISSDVGGQGELIDSEVGCLLPLLQDETEIEDHHYSGEEVSQYVNAIEKILSDEKEYEILCNNCRRKIEEKFSLDIMIHNLEEAFDRGLESARSEQRQEIASSLKYISNLIEEMLALYTAYESREQEAGALWRDLQWKNRSLLSDGEKRYEMLREYVEKIENSKSFKFGRMLTWFPRKLRNLLRSLKS